MPSMEFDIAVGFSDDGGDELGAGARLDRRDAGVEAVVSAAVR